MCSDGTVMLFIDPNNHVLSFALEISNVIACIDDVDRSDVRARSVVRLKQASVPLHSSLKIIIPEKSGKGYRQFEKPACVPAFFRPRSASP